MSRRTSEDDENHISNVASGHQTPEHADYADLSKVPSYSTAVRAPVRGMSYTDALPTYEAVSSAPPSPERTFSTPVSTSAPSENAHRRNPMSSVGFTPIEALPPVHLGDGDERRRLHWLQAGRERVTHQ
jgi:hypothetical protein